MGRAWGESRKSAYRKDIRRAISHGRKRFWSIVAISALGTMMFSGLQAGCQDLRVSADHFFDGQGLHDLEIVSTLGLSEDDVTALREADGTAAAAGIYSEKDSLKANDKTMDVDMMTINSENIDIPYAVEGSLPEKADEAAVSQKFAKDTGLGVGDTFTVRTEGTGSHLTVSRFTITSIVTDVTDIDNPFSAVSYRSDDTKANTVFILPDAVDADVYTSAVVTVEGAKDLFCFSDRYQESVMDAEEILAADVKEAREAARAEQVKADAQSALDEEKEAAESELEEARQKLDDSKGQLDDAKGQIAEGREQLDDQQSQLDEQKKQLEEGQSSLTEQQSQLDTQKQQALDQVAAAAGSDASQLDAETALPADMQAQLDAAQQQIDEGQAQIDAGLKQIADGQQQIDDARKELAAKESEYQEGLSDYEDGLQQYEEKKTDAEEQIADAQADIDAISPAAWYIRDRGSLSGYSNISSDADSIQSIGTVFPIVFFIVAFLISLTTVTRMVEEDRGLIGTYKSLGFTDREIRRKYISFAGFASLAGSVIGTALAFFALPAFLFTVFRIMYLLPEYRCTFVPGWGISGIAIFLVGIGLAASLACRSQLRQVPAQLMRPKTPPPARACCWSGWRRCGSTLASSGR